MSHLLHVIFWGALLFLALSFFGISVEKIMESPAGQANLAYISYVGLSIWNWFASYLGEFGFTQPV